MVQFPFNTPENMDPTHKPPDGGVNNGTQLPVGKERDEDMVPKEPEKDKRIQAYKYSLTAVLLLIWFCNVSTW